MKYFLAILTIIFVFTLGCGSSPKTAEAPVETPRSVVTAKPDRWLFPEGVYQQDVEVDILSKGHEREFDFQAVVKKSADEFVFSGHGTFGYTLFVIREKSGQVVQLESSVEEIKKNREFFLNIYQLVKTILSVKANDPGLKNNVKTIKTGKINAVVEFNEPDPNGVPRKLKVESKGQSIVLIETSSYDLKKD